MINELPIEKCIGHCFEFYFYCSDNQNLLKNENLVLSFLTFKMLKMSTFIKLDK